MGHRNNNKGKSFGLSSLEVVLRANLKDSDKIRLLKESSGIALSGNMEVYTSAVHIPHP